MAQDLLSSILEALMPATGMEQPMGLGGPERFSPNGTFRGPSVQPIAPPPGMSVQTQPLPVSDEIRRAFEPAYQPPAPGPATRPMPRPMAQPVQQQMPDGATDDRISAADVQRFIRSVATGAGRADPRAPAAAAVAQGAMGAMQNSYGEQERERMIAEQQAERRRVNDLRGEREARLQERMIAEQEDRRRRETRADRVAESNINYRNVQSRRITDPQLDNKDRIALERLVRDKERDLRREIDNGRLDEKAAKTKLEEYKRQIEDEFKAKKPRVAPQQTVPEPGNVYRHNGKTYRLKPGADPTKPESYEVN